MIRPVVLGLWCCVAVSSCEKARRMAETAKDAVVEQVEQVAGDSYDSSGKADADLQALVDETPEGYVFRKDLPYPAHVKVKIRSEREFKGRHFQSNLLGGGADQIDGTFHYGREIERNGDHATIVLTESRFTERSIEGSEKTPKDSTIIMPPATLKMERRKNGKWLPAMDGKALDFAMAAEVAGGNFDDVLAEEGLLPRPFWFGKQRVKIGDSLKLDGKHLAMLVSPGATGKLQIKLEAIEAIQGHPCGVFSVAGDLNLPKARHFEGDSGREQYTIESGKLWLSLLYPVILKEEIKGVVSSRSGESKASLQHSQGTVEILLERGWSALSGRQ